MVWVPISAIETAKGMQMGSLTSERIVRSCLERIRGEEEEARAGTFFDQSYAMEQARRLDAERRQGCHRGRLYGIPAAAKDIFATADMPGWLCGHLRSGPPGECGVRLRGAAEGKERRVP